jgi:ATP-dependent helicase/nuclease subunit B
VVRAKGVGSLAPVTVVVASNFAGLSARRLLAGDAARGRGVANVQFVTPFRLAEILSGDLLLGPRPTTNPVVGAAIRRVLVDEPGPFAEVAGHHATETALTSLYGELSHVSEATLTALGGAGGSAAVNAFRSIAARLGGFHGEDDVARAAAERPDLDTALEPLGHLVWYLPEPVTPAPRRRWRASCEQSFTPRRPT